MDNHLILDLKLKKRDVLNVVKEMKKFGLKEDIELKKKIDLKRQNYSI